MPTTEHNGTTSSDTLQGWKDIANYLGRSTRAVQRWERELDLPVHRIQTTNGQTVYALKPELDNWRKARDLPKPVAGEDDEIGAETNGNGNGHRHNATVEARQSPEPPRPGPRWLTVWSIAGVALAAGFLAGLYFRSPIRGPITSTQIAGTSVSAFDDMGRLVWRTEMGAQVTRASGAELQTTKLQALRMGKSRNLIMAVRYGTVDQATSGVSDALISFDEKGNIVWKVQPDLRLECGSDVFSAPWRLSAMTFSSDITHPRMWAAFNHDTWWPSQVVEIDDAGHWKVRFIQTGWIRGLTEWTTPSGQALMVNGVMNEYETASTTALPLDRGPAFSPHSDPRFDCATAPTGQPAGVTLWPRLDVRGPEAYPFASEAKAFTTGLEILLQQGGGSAVMEMDTPIHARSVALSDVYWVIHRQREKEGWVDHPAEVCPERTRPQPIEQWTPATGWVHTTIVPTVRQTAEKK